MTTTAPSSVRQHPRDGKKRFKVTSASFHNFLEESKLVNFIRRLSMSERDSSEIMLLKDDSLSDSTSSSSPHEGHVIMPKLDLSPLNGTKEKKNSSFANGNFERTAAGGMQSPRTSTPRATRTSVLPPSPRCTPIRSSPRRHHLMEMSPGALLSPGREGWPSVTNDDTPVTQITRALAGVKLHDSPSIHDESSRQSLSRKRLDFDSTSNTSDSSGSLDATRPLRGITASSILKGIQDDVDIIDVSSIRNNDSYILSPKLPPPAAPVVRKEPVFPPPPKFYFPQGKPISTAENDAALRRVSDVFRSLPGQTASFEDMTKICHAAGMPLYWKRAVFNCMAKGSTVTQMDFAAYWRAMTSVAHDEAARFVYSLTGGAGSQLRPEHFEPLVMDVIHTHPGLAFYRSSVEFHDKYCDVVVTRIFWNHGRAWSPYLTVEDIRRGDLLEKIRELETEEDINKSLKYFSYEHFYVIYCLFWEVDQDHDLRIKRSDLERHQSGAIPPMVVDRIFSRAVCRQPGKGRIIDIGIKEFTQFLLADEDKTHPSSVEYWFRILDEDGDGVISLYDMERYYGGIQEKLMQESIDCMKFNDVACNLIDAIMPKQETVFRRADLKNNKMAPRFFNSFVNWRKFYIQETTEGSDPVRLEDENGRELTDWDKFCAEEYESLMEAENDSYELDLDDEKDHVNGASIVSYNEVL